MSVQRARDEIKQAFPELVVDEVTFLGAGLDSQAYLVNGQWVFRFPKRPEVARALGRELALLPKLAGHLPVATPQFMYVGRRARGGLLFAGYRLIPGGALSPELFAALEPRQQERVLVTLAAFLRGVHNFPIADATACGVEKMSTRTWIEDCWAHGRARLQPLLPRFDALTLDRLIEQVLTDPRNFDGKPCLLYADFAPEHLLYNAAAGDITGIIDWGDLAIGDTDYDLLYLYQDYGQDFIRRLLAYHPHHEPERLMRKLRVFNACDQINTILMSGQDRAGMHDREAALAALLGILQQE